MLPGIFNTNLHAGPVPQSANMKRLFFFDAPGGPGKTFETSALQRYIKSEVLKVLTVASLAVFAQLLYRDLTAHSAFQIPFQVHHESTSSINVDHSLANELCSISLFILEKNMMTH